VTTAKRRGLLALALVALAAVVAYGAVTATLGGLRLPGVGEGLLLAVTAALALVALTWFHHSVHRSARSIAAQLDAMRRSGQVGLVMADGGSELTGLTPSLNTFLTGLRSQMEALRSENRELQIESRIAAAEKHHTEAIIFSISDAVIVTNRFDELVLANAEAEGLLGFKLSGALRQNIDRIIADGTLVRLIRETRTHGRSSPRKVVEHSIDRQGAPRTFNVTLSCVVTDEDEVSGVVAVLHDVTREKEIARMKTDFVSNVSHELKTPLASIKAYVEMLVDGEADDEKTRRDFYEIISAETDRLHRLIENILNISRIESGVVKVVREPVSLSAVVKQVLEVAAPQARQKDIRLVERLAPVYAQVEADRDMIYQAAMNLISNALKYTPEGGTVTVEVSVDERRKVAACSVADTGKGIPADDLPHIFDKFYRVGANRKMAKGTGLGLTLVKHIVETVHEGTLSVTSEQDAGSTFRFEMPILS